MNMCVFQVQNEGVSCEFCAKICKSKQGLNRHKAAKHKDQDLVTKPKSQEKKCFNWVGEGHNCEDC